MGCFTSVLSNSTISGTTVNRQRTNGNNRNNQSQCQSEQPANQVHRTSIMSDVSIYSISGERRNSLNQYKPNPTMLLNSMTQIAQNIKPSVGSSSNNSRANSISTATNTTPTTRDEVQLIPEECSIVKSYSTQSVACTDSRRTSKTQLAYTNVNSSTMSLLSHPFSVASIESMSNVNQTPPPPPPKWFANSIANKSSTLNQSKTICRRKSEPTYPIEHVPGRSIQTAPNIHFNLPDCQVDPPQHQPSIQPPPPPPPPTSTEVDPQHAPRKRQSSSQKSTKTNRTQKSKKSRITSVDGWYKRQSTVSNIDNTHSHRKTRKRHNSTSTRRTIMSKVSVASTWVNWFDTLLRHNSFLQAKSPAGETSVSANVPVSPFLIQEIDKHQNGVNCLELSEDCSLLASGGEDGIVRLWSTFSDPCECIGILIGHQSYITCCTIYRYLVVSGSADCTLKVWRIEDSNCLATLTGHTAFINRCICYGPLLLSSSFDNTVRIWALTDQLTTVHHVKRDSDLTDNLSDKDEVKTPLEIEDSVSRARFRATTNITYRKTINTHFGACLYLLEGHTKSVTQIAIVGGENSQSQLLNGVIQELDIVITTSTDGTARSYNLATGELRHVLDEHQGAINCLAVDTTNNQFVYTGGADTIIKCWDVVTGEHLRDLKGHQGTVLCLLAHKSILYSGSADNTVRAWAMNFGQCTRIYYRNTSSVTCIQYFKGILFTGSNDNFVRAYDANSAVLKQTFSGHLNAISSLRVVSGKLFTASFDSRILVWTIKELYMNTDTACKKETGKKGKSSIKPKPNRTVGDDACGKNSMQSLVQTAKTTKGNKIYPQQRGNANNISNINSNTNSNINSRANNNRILDNIAESNQLSTQLHLLYEQINSTTVNNRIGCCSISLKSVWLRCLSSSTNKSQQQQKQQQPQQIQNKPKQMRKTTERRTLVETSSEEDSNNVRLAIDALEPYIRSFQ